MKALMERTAVLAAITGALLCAGPANAQGSGGSLHAVGGFVGFTDRADADFTFGAEYEYRLQAPWSAGAILEYTPDARFGRDFTLLLGTAHYRPPAMPRLKLTGGAGVEFRDVIGDDIRFRIGAGYDVLEGPLTVTPRIAFDFGGGGENIVLGLSLLYGF